MRLVTFEAQTGFGKIRRLGAMHGVQVIDLQNAYLTSLMHQSIDAREASRLAAISLPATMESFIEGGQEAMTAAAQALAFIDQEGSQTEGDRRVAFAESEIALCAPLTRPNSLRDFIAFEDHARAGAARRNERVNLVWYERPIYYKGNHRSLIGPNDDLKIPGFTKELDFEMEVACIVGARCRDASDDEAANAIFGFTIMNDWSARDVQRGEMSARLGPAKSKDFATSIGPCIVTADELGPHPSLTMIARVNDDEVCRADLGAAHWKFPAMISFVSQGETVWPTDIYGSGTPFGGCMLDRGGPYLKPGDVVALEVESLGILTTRIL